MKRAIAAITLAASLAACTDAELIAVAHDQCEQLGYPVSSPAYVECSERGFRNSRAQADAAAGAAVGTAIAAVLWNSF